MFDNCGGNVCKRCPKSCRNLLKAPRPVWRVWNDLNSHRMTVRGILSPRAARPRSCSLGLLSPRPHIKHGRADHPHMSNVRADPAERCHEPGRAPRERQLEHAVTADEVPGTSDTTILSCCSQALFHHLMAATLTTSDEHVSPSPVWLLVL